MGFDPVEAEAIRAEGHDPDDPDVLAAIDLVRWELELLTLRWAGVLPQASTSQP